MGGFSFCGMHCSDLGIGYIPKPAQRMLSTAPFEQMEEDITARAGGYYYGVNVTIREFQLYCYFEDISTSEYERIIRHFHRGREGKLIFDDRPDVFYMVRVADIIKGDSYTHHDMTGANVHSATFTLKFKAYDPFGHMSITTYRDGLLGPAVEYSGIIEASKMPAPLSPVAGDYLVYNPGTEMANTVIRIAGNAPNGVTITNHTTGDVCKLLAVPQEPIYLEIDSESGSVKSLADGDDEFSFELHDMGYITLAPCTPYWRETSVNYTAGSNQATVKGLALSDEIVGKYMLLNGEWVRCISRLGDETIVLNKFMSVSGIESTIVAVMNEITVEAEGANLTMLELTYTPRVR